MEQRNKIKKEIFKECMQAPVMRPFWRKDKNGEATGIYADYVCKASQIPIQSSKDCFIFSWCISEFIMVPLKNMLEEAIAANDAKRIQKIKGTINWLRKKAFRHSAEVRNEMKAMSEHPEFLKAAGYLKAQEGEDKASDTTEAGLDAERLGLSAAEIKEIMLEIAGLHDIGRLAEIDLQNAAKFNGPDMIAHEVQGVRVPVKGTDHAITSYEVAKANGVTNPLILLPVKYHGVMDLKAEIADDTEFMVLDEIMQDYVLLLGHCIRDADKIANLISYTKTGVKLCGEVNDPNYHGNNDISDEVINDFMSGRTINRKSTKTYLDTMFKFVSWTYDLHFAFNKERASKTIINPLFERMREENRDELADTIKEARHNWRLYEELVSQQQSGKLSPDLAEKLKALEAVYVCKEKRPQYWEDLKIKALKSLDIINQAQTYIINYMSCQPGNIFVVQSSRLAGKSALPRTANTSARFQLKRRAERNR